MKRTSLAPPDSSGGGMRRPTVRLLVPAPYGAETASSNGDDDVEMYGGGGKSERIGSVAAAVRHWASEYDVAPRHAARGVANLTQTMFRNAALLTSVGLAAYVVHRNYANVSLLGPTLLFLLTGFTQALLTVVTSRRRASIELGVRAPWWGAGYAARRAIDYDALSLLPIAMFMTASMWTIVVIWSAG